MQYTIQAVLVQAWQQFRDQTFTVLPHLLASLFIFVVGLLLGMVVSRLAKWALRSSNIDRGVARLGLAASLDALGISSTVRLLAGALQAVILLLTSNLALYSLDARLASDLAERFFLYLPHLAVAIVILGAGMVLARFLSRSVLIAAVNSDIRAARLLGGFTRAAVMIVAGAMAFEHLGISRETVLTAFAIVFGGVTLAASIASGLAMQDVARRWVAAQLAPPEASETERIEHW
jgi:uncharacterized membrane protein YcfT